MWLAAAVAVVVAGATAVGPAAAQHEISGRVAVESRWFPRQGAYPGQRNAAGGLAVESKLYLQVAESTGFTLVPFFRYDAADPARTHGDLREAYLLFSGPLGESEWELRLGLDDVQGAEFIVGALLDLDYDSRTLNIEFNRLLTDSVSVKAEATLLLHVDKSDLIVHQSRRDSFVALNLTYNF